MGVTDSMALPVISGHVSNTPCESCDFPSVCVLVRVVVYVVAVSRVDVKSM